MKDDFITMMQAVNYDKLREMIARCQWKFARTMPFAPHEYIVRGKCPLTDEEFVYFIDMQRHFGVKERWGKYNNPYLYIDDYKYWTMGDPYDVTTVINRAKACVVDDAHKLYEGMKQLEGNKYVDEYIHKKLGLKPEDKGYTINLLNGRLTELDACCQHLRRIREAYGIEMMKEWSQRLSEDFPDCKKNEYFGGFMSIYTGIVLPFKEIPEGITIRIEMMGRSLYYGLNYLPETKPMQEELLEAFAFLETEDHFAKGINMINYKYTSFEEGYDKLKQLIERIM